MNDMMDDHNITVDIKLKIYTCLSKGLEPDYYQIAPKDYNIHKFNQIIAEIKTLMGKN